MIYNGPVDLSDLKETVNRTVRRLKPLSDEFDLIAVTGMSGVLVGPAVALKLKKPLLVIRKESDVAELYRHRNTEFLGWEPGSDEGRALWIDDFVSDGGTKRRVAKKLLDRGAEMKFAYLYRDDEISPRGFDAPEPAPEPALSYNDEIPF